jgi:hypothetical protein
MQLSKLVELPSLLCARFDANVQKTSTCWLWTGRKVGALGYGQLRYGRRTVCVYAHRYAYERFVGSIPKGLKVLHRCDVPACVNPDHLFVGTSKDNTQDMIAKGRGWSPFSAKKERTHCSHGHEFTVANTYPARGGKKRVCRTCQRNADARRRSG